MIETQLKDLIVGSSAAIRRLRDTIARVGPSKLPVLILGPTGAGKELVARGLHLASGRAGKFETCNVCALTPGLFESEVFGHVRGAFTGALRDKRGHLVEANGGTMFFDEIGGLNLESQPKLLRALDGYAFRPVGASQDRLSDFRVIAATNEDVPAMVAAGRFRADLWYRLAGITLCVPALSARLDDVPALVEHLLTRLSSESKRRPQCVSACAIRALQSHAWGGNVRELAVTLERAVLLAQGEIIDATHIMAAIQMVSRRVHGLQKATDDQVISALDSAAGDVSLAAQILGVSRPTIYRHLAALGLTPRQWHSSWVDSQEFLARVARMSVWRDEPGAASEPDSVS
ncbi:MAG TPA: sigma 54-interacting transcriptional regulator [Gemmatimonadaceae bacterium]|nr:sigma 54-interacting transcriptional regulator [Gemmatimonadaceae bacterium]